MEQLPIGSSFEEDAQNQKKENKMLIRDITAQQSKFSILFQELRDDKPKFYQHFRVSQEKFFDLCKILNLPLRKKYSNLPRTVGLEERIAVTLRYLIAGETFRDIAEQYSLGESTVNRIMHDTCDVIWTVLGSIVMPCLTEEKWEYTEKVFASRFNLPNCIGCVDGKKILANTSLTSENIILALFSVVDAEYRFLLVEVGKFEDNNDGAIFWQSSLAENLNNGTLCIPPDKPLPGTMIPLPHVLLADEKFPLKKNLMCPYSDYEVDVDQSKNMYNCKLAQARKIVDDTYEILSNKFGFYKRKIKINAENAKKAVLATCCLHNYLIDDTWYCSSEQLTKWRTGDSMCSIRNRAGNMIDIEASIIREQFKNYFCPL